MEAYIPAEFLAGDPQLAPLLVHWYENPEYPAWCRQRGAFNLSAWLAAPEPPAPHHPFEPGFLFDAGMRPFAAFPLRGFTWYQGESNATEDGARGAPVAAAVNRRKLTALIESWRRAWDDPELPFLFAQLPGLDRPWTVFREVQAQVARDTKNVHMAVTIDVGHPTNVHPRRKKPVGERLARLALAHVHGKDIVAGGPVLRAHETVGAEIRVSFDQVGGGLASRDGQALREFTIAGDDRVFHPATAAIRGDRVVVSSAKVQRPVAVRYAWCSDPDVNLVNAEQLPAAPFRTDPW